MIKRFLLCLSLLCISCRKECPELDVRFSPNGGVADSMVSALGKATSDVRVQAFSFTSEPISSALIVAKKRGIKVVVVLDKENLSNKSSALLSLHAAGIPIYIDSKHAIAHNKLIIIDEDRVFTGSYNFSKGAEEKNAENSILITDKSITKLYAENFELHREHSYIYTFDE